MAITWTLRINKIGSSDSFSVSATVKDDTKSVGNQEEIVSVLSAKMDTPERKKAVWDNLKAQYLAKVSKTDVTTVMEDDGKTYLEK